MRKAIAALFWLSDVFILGAALIALVISVIFFVKGQISEGLITAIWVPSILGFGLYIKMMSLKARYFKDGRNVR